MYTCVSFGLNMSYTSIDPKEVSIGILSIRGRPMGSFAYPGRCCVSISARVVSSVVTLSVPLGLHINTY